MTPIVRCHNTEGPEDHFKPAELSNLTWAFAKCKHGTPELFEIIGCRALDQLAWYVVLPPPRPPLTTLSLFQIIGLHAPAQVPAPMPALVTDFKSTYGMTSIAYVGTVQGI
jgi:hypothetical protein